MRVLFKNKYQAQISKSIFAAIWKMIFCLKWLRFGALSKRFDNRVKSDTVAVDRWPKTSYHDLFKLFEFISREIFGICCLFDRFVRYLIYMKYIHIEMKQNKTKKMKKKKLIHDFKLKKKKMSL